MRRLRLCRDAARTNRIIRQGSGILAGAMIIGAMIIGAAGSAFAKGGYGPPKQPMPFAPKELLLIERCRTVAQTDGTDSVPFLRQCSAVRFYIHY